MVLKTVILTLKTVKIPHQLRCLIYDPWSVDYFLKYTVTVPSNDREHIVVCGNNNLLRLKWGHLFSGIVNQRSCRTFASIRKPEVQKIIVYLLKFASSDVMKI